MFLTILFIGIIGIFADWIIGQLRTDTSVSTASSATVQSARINIFQSPYFRFQANQSWREVSDELSFNKVEGSEQYLYRSFDKDFIEHELWVTVNLPLDYVIERHNVPTRVVPIRVESDGTLNQIGNVSAPCVEALPASEKENVTPRVIKQEEISYFCNPNQVNDYHVAVGVPGGTNRISYSDKENGAVVTITYRNVTAIPTSSELENILSTFKLL